LLPITHYLRRPIHTIRLLAYRVYELRHPDEPWISQGAVKFCDRNLSRADTGLEWGSGRSTRWFALRLGRLVSVEYDPDWHRKVVETLRDIGNAYCQLIPLDHPPEQPVIVGDCIPAYVAIADEFPADSLGLVIVDGHYRQACVKRVLAKIKPGGLLLIDNTDRMPLAEWGVPASWPVVHRSRNVRTETTIWRKP
jgi:hypothetical protein